MSFASVLHDLVCKDARLFPTENHELHLMETDPSVSLKKVIVGLRKDEVISCIALDFKIPTSVAKSRSSCLSEVLNPESKHPLRAACDALVCIEKNNVCHLIHVELKSGDDKRAVGQLSNSGCFSRFLRDLARNWHGVTTSDCREWFVLLTSGPKAAARKAAAVKPNIPPSGVSGFTAAAYRQRQSMRSCLDRGGRVSDKTTFGALIWPLQTAVGPRGWRG